MSMMLKKAVKDKNVAKTNTKFTSDKHSEHEISN